MKQAEKKSLNYKIEGNIMKQIPIGFDKKTEEKLRKNSKERDIKLAQYVRSLVEIGLRVEEMSEQKANKQNAKDELLDELIFHKKLLQKGLVSNYESLYLIRYILAHLPEDKLGEHNQMLDNAQMKAKSLVEGLSG